MKIRTASLEDVNEIEKLLHLYYKEGNLDKLTYSSSIVVKHLFEYVVYNGSDILVAETDKIIGVSLLALVKPIFTVDTIAENRILYVAKEHRGSMAGPRLIKRSKQWAKDNRAYYLMIGTSSEINTDRTEKLYSKLGFKQVGSDFITEI